MFLSMFPWQLSASRLHFTGELFEVRVRVPNAEEMSKGVSSGDSLNGAGSREKHTAVCHGWRLSGDGTGTGRRVKEADVASVYKGVTSYYDEQTVRTPCSGQGEECV